MTLQPLAGTITAGLLVRLPYSRKHNPSMPTTFSTKEANEMLPVFADVETEEQFRRNGYVILPLLTPDQVRALIELSQSWSPSIPAEDPVSQSVFSSPDTRRLICADIRKIVEPCLKGLLP